MAAVAFVRSLLRHFRVDFVILRGYRHRCATSGPALGFSSIRQSLRPCSICPPIIVVEAWTQTSLKNLRMITGSAMLSRNYRSRTASAQPASRTQLLRCPYGTNRCIRPISLLRLSLLRFLDSKISGEFPVVMRIPPLRIKILLESNPPKSRILVRRLAVPAEQEQIRLEQHEPAQNANPSAERPQNRTWKA